MICTTLFAALTLAVAAAAPEIVREDLFPPEAKHNHASCVVELPGGDLVAAWYRGSGERQADDVQIFGARLKKGERRWGDRFVMADTPGYPDCNPALFAAPDGALWLFYPTILDHRWEGALLKFAVARDPKGDGPPRWTREGVVHVTPVGFDRAMAAALADLRGRKVSLDESAFDRIEARSRDLLYQRLGWMPRVHPVVLPSGRWLLPVYSDTFSASLILRSDDRGASWAPSTPLIGFGNIQPSLVRKGDGTLVAFMRDNGPHRRIRLSRSTDDGASWDTVTDSTLPNPGAGIEAIRLADGLWALAYNDTSSGRHSLAVSLSEDEGATWKWTRHLERSNPGTGQYHYPSLIQAADGSLHATYTHRAASGSTIRHARFGAEWIKRGD